MKKNVITIGREYGSGGYEIAEKLAKELNFKFYDKELIAAIAEKNMISESYVKAAEENAVKRNIFHELVPIFLNESDEQTNYIFNEQGKFIVNLAREGNCVIIGRRADYYLRDDPNAIHIFFYADLDFRIDRISRTFECSREEALKKIQNMDKRRRSSYEYTTGRKWGDIHNYDRVICTSSLGIDACVKEIADLIR